MLGEMITATKKILDKSCKRAGQGFVLGALGSLTLYLKPFSFDRSEDDLEPIQRSRGANLARDINPARDISANFILGAVGAAPVALAELAFYGLFLSALPLGLGATGAVAGCLEGLATETTIGRQTMGLFGRHKTEIVAATAASLGTAYVLVG